MGALEAARSTRGCPGKGTLLDTEEFRLDQICRDRATIDRDERPGVKFKDADLVGFPIRLGIGEKSLAKGEVEIKPRGGSLQSVKSGNAVEAVMKLLGENSRG